MSRPQAQPSCPAVLRSQRGAALVASGRPPYGALVDLEGASRTVLHAAPAPVD